MGSCCCTDERGNSTICVSFNIFILYSYTKTITSNYSNIAEFPKTFVSAVNEMIRRNSADTAVTFLNLPVPPSPSLNRSDEYMEALRTLTTDLPPTLLVCGLSSVISTAL